MALEELTVTAPMTMTEGAEASHSERPRIIIGVTLEKSIPTKVLPAFFYFAQQGYPFVGLPSTRPDKARTEMAFHILNKINEDGTPEFTHLLLLDGNTVYSLDTVKRMEQAAIEKPDTQIFFGTTGAILARRDTFEILPQPWFCYTDNTSDADDDTDYFFQTCLNHNGLTLAHVDLSLKSPVNYGHKDVQLVMPPENRYRPEVRFPIAIPLEETMRDVAFNGFLGIFQQRYPYLYRQPTRCDVARNDFAQYVVEHSEYSHVIMLDSDHVHPWYTARRLATWVTREPDYGMIGGLNFKRGEPYSPCAFFLNEQGLGYSLVEWPQGAIPVDLLGTGCVIISREALERVEQPWFGYDYSQVHLDIWSGVDIWFSRRCKAQGIKLLCDCTLISPHIADLLVDAGTFQAYEGQHKELETLGINYLVRGNSDNPEVMLAAVKERDRVLREKLPQLFDSGKAGKLLYVGANKKRSAYMQELADVGQEITLLEVWPQYAADFVEDPNVKRVVVGNICNADAITELDVYDTVFWWHGPEHIRKEELAATLAKLEARVKPGGLVVLGCPWGVYPQAPIDGNPHQAHWSALYPENLTALGYEVVTTGEKDVRHSGIIAWKGIG